MEMPCDGHEAVNLKSHMANPGTDRDIWSDDPDNPVIGDIFQRIQARVTQMSPSISE